VVRIQCWDPGPVANGRGKEGTPNHLWALAFLASVLIFGQGCAAALAAGSAIGFGLSYYSSNVAERSFTAEMPRVWGATERALDEMVIQVVEKELGDGQGEIQAAATELTITIEVKAVSPMTTRVLVNAAQPNLLRDMATATEILEQINAQLGKGPPRGTAQVFRGPATMPTRPASATNGASPPGTGVSPERPAGLVRVKVTAANVRAAADRHSKVLAVLQQGTKLEKIAESPGWVKVRLPGGTEGFIAQGLVNAIEEPAPMDARAKTVSLPPVPMEELRGSQ
jgi:hypothetical protein